MSLRWAELAPRPDRKRFEALSKFLNENSLENEVTFVLPEADFEASLRDCQTKFGRLRLGGEACGQALKALPRAPTLLLSLGAADTLTPHSVDTGKPLPVEASPPNVPVKADLWWPRCSLVEGLMRLIVTDLGRVDLSGGVFVLGAGFEARAVIAAMTRLGFNRFTISDLAAQSEGPALCEELRRTYFECQFQFVERHLITQLPSVHSVAANTLVGPEHTQTAADHEAMSELFYFNFLKPQGLWLDLSCVPKRALEAEARAMGLTIVNGAQVAAWTDVEWVQDVLGLRLDQKALAERYAAAFETHEAENP